MEPHSKWDKHNARIREDKKWERIGFILLGTMLGSPAIALVLYLILGGK